MYKEQEDNKVRTLHDISERYAAREITGCVSWRHYAVHKDREWLLRALGKIRDQVEKIRQAENDRNKQDQLDAEVRALLKLFEEENLNHLGDLENA